MKSRLEVSKILDDAKAAGETTYFTGNPCKHGHIAPRTVTGSSCIECIKQNYNKEKYKDARMKNTYGISLAEYETMRLEQNNTCAICKDNFHSDDNDNRTIDGGVNVDHCHTTGDVRGLLCPSCNRGLGMFKDDIKLLNAAIQYLDFHLIKNEKNRL